MTSNRKTDELLIKEFQNGNRSSYAELVNRYRDKIISFLYRYMHDMDAAEDLAQEAFLKYILKKDSYKETFKFSTWLFTIASNLAKTELRKLKEERHLQFLILMKMVQVKIFLLMRIILKNLQIMNQNFWKKHCLN